MQAVTIGLGSAVIAAFEGFGEVTAIVVVAVLVTGIACSAIAFSLAAWGQRIVDPERSGVISLLEPVVAGIIGYFVGERLGVSGYLGAALILASILVVERGTCSRGAAPIRADGHRATRERDERSAPTTDVTRVTRS